MKPVSSLYPTLVVAVVLALTTGCLNLEPRTNPTEYFILGGEWEEAVETGRERLGLSVGLRQIQLAAYLETPRIVVRQGPHEIRFSEYNRWGEDLNRGINRTVAGYLAAHPAVGRVDVVPWPRSAGHDYNVQLRVLRFEGLAAKSPPEAEEQREGQVHVLATWEIVDATDGAVLAQGTTDFVEDGWLVGDYAKLAAMLDAGLRVLAEEIGIRLEMLPAQ